jgi:hypothetical protein
MEQAQVMNIQKASKHTKAFWRSEARFEALWAKEPIDHATLQAMIRGHAAGWMSGVAWQRRNTKTKLSNAPHEPVGA